MELRWESFSHFLSDRAATGQERTAFSLYEGGGWRTVSFREVDTASRERARSLLRSGHQPGDRIAVLAATSLDLPVQLFGIILAGAVAVPLDPKLSPAELLAILKHVEPRTLIVAQEFRALGIELQQDANIPKLLYLEEKGALPLAGPESRERGPDDTVAIYYTSGTNGQAKGVMVSARAILAEVTMLTSLQENGPHDVMFSILPLNHLYGLTAGVVYSLACGAEYVFAHSLAPAEIGRCLQERKVTQMNVVPLLLNLMRRGIQAGLQEQPKAKRLLVATFLKVAPFLPLALRRKLFAPIHEKLGGALRRSVSGAAPLDPATFSFFRAIGAPIFEGYGLTETGPVLTVNRTRRVKKGSAGIPLPGIEVRIDAAPGERTGEILTRGPHLMQGYFRDPELTREKIDADGWFHTGDLGHFDGPYLRITGRRKSLVVLASGKKVHAEEVEQALAMSHHFQDVCVLGIPNGDQGELLTAVVHPTEEFLALPNYQKAAEQEVANACRTLAAFKRPGRVIVRRTAFAKTSSGKVKRHVVRDEVLSSL